MNKSELNNLKNLAEQGDADSQFELGDYYFYEKEDDDKAFEWYMKAAEQNHAMAQKMVGDCFLEGIGVEENPETAVEWYRKAAEQNDEGAQFQLGECYYDGIGVEEDEDIAFEWYMKAAENDFADAQSIVAEYYLDDEEFELAFVWYKRAAENDVPDPHAQRRVGDFYYEGEHVKQDFKAAAQWYKKAAAEGNEYAQFKLAECYYNGTGVNEDKEKACELYKKAADHGNRDAIAKLAEYYQIIIETDDDEYDDDEVVFSEELMHAAEQGDAEAQFQLAECYFFGDGIEEDEEEARKWYQKAADQGNEEAIERLSEYYEEAIERLSEYYYDMNYMKGNKNLRGYFERTFLQMVNNGVDLKNPSVDILEKEFDKINKHFINNKLKPFTKSEFKELFETFAKEYMEKEETK